MARADAGLTISQLAEKAGVSRDTVSKAEKGQHNLQAGTLSKVARALGMSASELLAEEESHIPKDLARPSGSPAALPPGVRAEAEINTLQSKMRKQQDLDRQAINRAKASEGVQGGSRDSVNEVNAQLRELPEEDKDEIVIRLVEEVLSLQDRIAVLEDKNAELEEVLRERV